MIYISRVLHGRPTRGSHACHGHGTVAEIQAIAAVAHPWDEIDRFTDLSSTKRLTGIDQPFYRDWLYADPMWFLMPDYLHDLLN
jgi:hypothetical protein